MTRKFLILIITSLVLSTINGQTATDDDFIDNDVVDKSKRDQETAEQPSEEPVDDGTPQVKSENPDVPEATENSTPAQEVTTKSNLRTTVIDGQVYVLMPAPNPFPNLGPSPFYLRPQAPQYPPQPPAYPPQLPHYPPQPIPHPYPPPMMPFIPMPHSMMFPPPMPPMIKPGDLPLPMIKPGNAPNPPGSQVILLNQQKNPGDAVVGQSTVYLKPDGNREIIIIK